MAKTIFANLWIASYVAGLNARLLSIAIVRATNVCMRGSRIPAHKMSNKFPTWEDGAGLALFERLITIITPDDSSFH
jgi:hypothetical protein